MPIGQPVLLRRYAPCVHLYVTCHTYTPVRSIIIPLKGVVHRNVCSALVVVMKVRKLCFWRCCECYSCKCCDVFPYLFSGGSYCTMLRILYYWHLGNSYVEIAQNLTEIGCRATKVGILKFLQRYKQTGTPSRKASKMMDIAKGIIDEQMHKQLALLLCLVYVSLLRS